jgi:hypothetical protein
MVRRNANATVQVNARIKETLRRKLAAAAKTHQVSFNRELTTRLEDSFQRESFDNYLYKLGVAQMAQSGKRAEPTILGGATEAETPAPQQEQKRTRRGG